MFTASLGNILIVLSFVLVSSLRTTSNCVLFGLAVTDLGVGLIVHPLYLMVLYQVYENHIPDCKIMTAYSVSTTVFAGVSPYWFGSIFGDSTAFAISTTRHRKTGQYDAAVDLGTKRLI